MKRIIGIMLTFVMALTGMVGCNNAGGAATADGGVEEVELRISWWGSDTRHQATLRAIDLFQEKYPHITVRPEYTGWDGHQEKLTTQIGGGTAPDLMQVNWNWLTMFSPNGDGFYDLNELSDIIELDNFPETALQAGEMNGVLNGVPVAMTGRVLLLNETAYEKYGSDIPTTWDGFFEAAEKFGEGSYPFILAPYDAWLLVVAYIEQYTGSSFIDADGEIAFTLEDIQLGLEFYEELVERGVIPSAPEVAGQGDMELTTMPSWIEGDYAGAYAWTSASTSVVSSLEGTDQSIVFAGLPTIEEAKSSGVFARPSMLWAINKGTDHPEEAAVLMNFLLNDPEAASELGLERGVPISEVAVQVLEDEDVIDGLELEGLQFITENHGAPASPYFEDAELQQIYSSAIEQIGFGNMDAREAAEYVFNNVQTRLDELKR